MMDFLVALYEELKGLFILVAIFVMLGIWKAVEIAIYLFNHISITMK